jgi:hypothetical protein
MKTSSIRCFVRAALICGILHAAIPAGAQRALLAACASVEPRPHGEQPRVRNGRAIAEAIRRNVRPGQPKDSAAVRVLVLTDGSPALDSTCVISGQGSTLALAARVVETLKTDASGRAGWFTLRIVIERPPRDSFPAEPSHDFSEEGGVFRVESRVPILSRTVQHGSPPNRDSAAFAMVFPAAAAAIRDGRPVICLALDGVEVEADLARRLGGPPTALPSNRCPSSSGDEVVSGTEGRLQTGAAGRPNPYWLRLTQLEPSTPDTWTARLVASQGFHGISYLCTARRGAAGWVATCTHRSDWVS